MILDNISAEIKNAPCSIREWNTGSNYLFIECLDERFLILKAKGLCGYQNEVEQFLSSLSDESELPTERQLDIVFANWDKLSSYIGDWKSWEYPANIMINRKTANGRYYGYNVPCYKRPKLRVLQSRTRFFPVINLNK